MKRRSLFGALAALVAAPFVAAKALAETKRAALIEQPFFGVDRNIEPKTLAGFRALTPAEGIRAALDFERERHARAMSQRFWGGS